jgi:PilZ domain
MNGTAVLTREFQARVLNVSGSGCLVESNRPLRVGTTATLWVLLDGEKYFDDVQVVRCRRIEGAGFVHHVGVTFLWTALPHERSIRHAVARHTEWLDAESNSTRVM